MNVNLNKLKIGDRLVRNKGGIFTKHHALYAGNQNGSHLVAENQTGHGVRIITLNQFISEGKIDRIEHYDFDRNSQLEIMNRIEQRIGREYSLLDYNCEHFVNEVLTGLSKSNQVNKGLMFGALGIFALWIFGGSSK